MTTNLVVNGVTYAYPTQGDYNWGSAATGWAQAITAGMLQKAGGSFTLTADVDFGATYGLKSAYFKTRDAAPASAGQFRLGNAEVISWRDAGDSGDLDLTVDATDSLSFNGNVIADFGTVSSTEYGYLSGVTSAIQTQLDAKIAKALLTTRGDIIVEGAAAPERLALGASGTVLTSDGTDAVWAAATTSTLTTRGDVLTRDAGALKRLALGTSGQLLSSDGTDLVWAAPPVASPLTTQGDLYFYDATNDRLPIGTTGQVLVVDGSGKPAWASAFGTITTDTIDTYDDITSNTWVQVDGVQCAITTTIANEVVQVIFNGSVQKIGTDVSTYVTGYQVDSDTEVAARTDSNVYGTSGSVQGISFCMPVTIATAGAHTIKLVAKEIASGTARYLAKSDDYQAQKFEVKQTYDWATPVGNVAYKELVIDVQHVTSTDNTNTSYAAIANTSQESFTVPSTGEYTFVLSSVAQPNSGDMYGYYRLVIDKGTGSEQILGDSDVWIHFYRGLASPVHEFVQFKGIATLTVGTHTLDAEIKVNSGETLRHNANMRTDVLVF